MMEARYNPVAAPQVQAALADETDSLPGGRGGKRPNRSDAGFYAMQRATVEFLNSTEQFAIGEFHRALKRVSHGRKFDAYGRLNYFVQKGRVRKIRTGFYEVVKS